MKRVKKEKTPEILEVTPVQIHWKIGERIPRKMKVTLEFLIPPVLPQGYSRRYVNLAAKAARNLAREMNQWAEISAGAEQAPITNVGER